MTLYAVLGATGKVGSATSSALRKAGVSVRAVLHDASKADQLSSIGCEIAVADKHDVGSLTRAFTGADAIQVVLPLNPMANDPPADMRDAIESLVSALEAARPKRILLISDYGAHVPHDIGMPSIFHSLEKRLGQLDGHKLFVRSAEHMENWLRVIPAAQASGAIPVFCDPDTLLPTVSAADVGSISADLLMLPPVDGTVTQVIHVEGPRRYSARDVAGVLSELLGRTVVAERVPRHQWDEVFREGMGSSLAELMIKTNDAHNKGGLIDVEPGSTELRHGGTEVKEALRARLGSQAR